MYLKVLQFMYERFKIPSKLFNPALQTRYWAAKLSRSRSVNIQWSQTCVQASLSTQNQETHYSVSEFQVVIVSILFSSVMIYPLSLLIDRFFFFKLSTAGGKR